MKPILFFLLFVLFFFPLLTHSLTLGSFVEYKVIIHVTKYTEYALEIENVTHVFRNGTFSFEIWFVNLNGSYYYPPGINYDNLTYPKVFYYIPHVGNKTIYRDVPLNLIGKNGSYFIYKGLQPLGASACILWIIYVNETGVPTRITLLQYENGFIISNTTYLLFRSNIVNQSAHLYFPSNVTITSGKRVSFYVVPPLFLSTHKRFAFIVALIVIIGLTVYLTFRKTPTSSRR